MKKYFKIILVSLIILLFIVLIAYFVFFKQDLKFYFSENSTPNITHEISIKGNKININSITCGALDGENSCNEEKQTLSYSNETIAVIKDLIQNKLKLDEDNKVLYRNQNELLVLISITWGEDEFIKMYEEYID